MSFLLQALLIVVPVVIGFILYVVFSKATGRGKH